MAAETFQGQAHDTQFPKGKTWGKVRGTRMAAVVRLGRAPALLNTRSVLMDPKYWKQILTPTPKTPLIIYFE